ncbi:MAG: hypothetical protein CL681_00720 [Blastopirellula sp.]|nr:hypothetical protein [Blastopirellula sp.]
MVHVLRPPQIANRCDFRNSYLFLFKGQQLMKTILIGAASFLTLVFLGGMAYADTYDGRPDVVWGDTDAAGRDGLIAVAIITAARADAPKVPEDNALIAVVIITAVDSGDSKAPGENGLIAVVIITAMDSGDTDSPIRTYWFDEDADWLAMLDIWEDEADDFIWLLED